MNKQYFLDCLVQKWDNLHQAQAHPTNYTHVHYDWDYEDDILKSKQWYHYNGEVYRERTHSLEVEDDNCLLYTSPSPRDRQKSRMPSSA